MHTVAVVTAGQPLHFEFGMACEIFGTPPREATGDWYDLVLCGPGQARVGPFVVEPDHGLEHVARADTVIVPACASIDDPPPDALIEALRSAHDAGVRIASLCTGAFTLGAAGLLDGRRATTHWAHAAELSARYPRAMVDADVLYTDNGTVLTSAGKAAAADLCLHLIHLDHGATIANGAARRLVMPPHRDGGQAQFVATPMQVTAGQPLAGLLDWAMQHLGEPLTVTDLARRANMSARTLGRHFQAVTGQTPIQWLLTQRVRRAQELLEATDASIESVAVATGMGTATTLRRRFKRVVGIPPTNYRRSFRPPPPSRPISPNR